MTPIFRKQQPSQMNGKHPVPGLNRQSTLTTPKNLLTPMNLLMHAPSMLCLSGKRRFRILFLLIAILWLGIAVCESSAQVTRSFTEPIESSQVAAADPGVLGKTYVKEGDRVVTGQPLAELKNEVLQRTLEIALLHAESDAKVRSAEATLRIRKQKYTKLQPLLEVGHANSAEVEKAQAEYEAAVADLELARQEAEEDRLEVARIRAQINRTIIHSPIDGWVTQIHHRPGEYVSINQPQVATVVKLDQLRVRFYLLASDVQKLQANQQVNVLLDDDETKQVPARVEFVSPVTDPDSGTTRVDLLIDNAALQHRSGIPCQWLEQSAGETTRQ